MYNIGSIILITYFIFDNTQGKNIDHAKHRPCIVIGEDKENVYFLPISSSYAKCNSNCKYKIPSKYIDNNKDEYVNFNNIYSKKICGYYVKDDIDENDLYNLLLSFYQYHVKNNNNEIFKNIKNIVYEEIMRINIKNQKTTHKRR